MDIELEKLAAKWGGRLMHTESQHEVISFRPDGFAGFAKEVQRIEREACAKVCEDVISSGDFDGHQQYAAAACRNKIRERSNLNSPTGDVG